MEPNDVLYDASLCLRYIIANHWLLQGVSIRTDAKKQMTLIS